MINETLIGSNLKFSPELCNVAVGALFGIGSVGMFIIKIFQGLILLYAVIYFIKRWFNYLEFKNKQTDTNQIVRKTTFRRINR